MTSLFIFVAFQSSNIIQNNCCYPFKAKIAAFLWGLVASVRRVIGIVSFFAPCLGLLNLLWHYHAEQFPFKVTIIFASNNG